MFSFRLHFLVTCKNSVTFLSWLLPSGCLLHIASSLKWNASSATGNPTGILVNLNLSTVIECGKK